MTSVVPTSDPLVEERFGSVVTLRLNNPAKRNPLSFGVARELAASLRRLNDDADVRAVILTGTDQSFCVGGDQRDFSAAMGKSPTELLDDYPPLDVFRMGRAMRKPLIAAVNGTAFGGGMGITCMCHFAIAADTAVFGVPEIKLGIFPLTILPLIRPVLGDRLTLDLSLTGRSISAEEALRHGVVQEVVPRDDLMDRALALATELAGRSPVAVTLGLMAFAESTDMSYEEAMDYTNVVRAMSFSSEDLNEGSRAFLEKRAPVWTGR